MQQSRLKWQCRRGMRELDVLLTGYLEEQYADSCQSEKEAFQKLLELPDPELNSYLLGGVTPVDKEIAVVVARLRGRTYA